MFNSAALGDIALIKQGRYLAPADLNEIKTDQAPIPVWGANGLLGYTTTPTYESPQPLVTCRGNGCGLVQWTGGPANISNNSMAIVLQEANSYASRYLYYCLLSSNFSDVTTGSAQPQITVTHLKDKQIFWTDNACEQQSIVDILGSLDDKIELNRMNNKTLEGISRALFKSWFVDFDPVRAKADGRSTGLPDEISELFPDSLEESELGEIPIGWEVQLLGEVLSIQYGKNLPTKNLIPIGFPVFGGNGVIGFHSDYLFDDAMTLVSCRGAASGAVLRTLPKSFVTNNSLVIDHRNTAIPSQRYVEFFLSITDISVFVTGSAQPQITIDSIRHLPILIPQRRLLAVFQDLLAPIENRSLLMDGQSKSLGELRDALLPQLISGELRVPDAEKMLEEVGI